MVLIIFIVFPSVCRPYLFPSNVKVGYFLIIFFLKCYLRSILNRPFMFCGTLTSLKNNLPEPLTVFYFEVFVKKGVTFNI